MRRNLSQARHDFTGGRASAQDHEVGPWGPPEDLPCCFTANASRRAGQNYRSDGNIHRVFLKSRWR
ncbi:hypothetical protein CITRIK5_60353 [Citricoccus sp. K5]|nr:hypothetical protein CITRIK5_60353 [Citricoccus sp. K5]